MTFAMITEGVSENRILSNIMQRYLGDEAVTNPIQPRIEHGKQASSGGWSEVLSHMTNEVIKDALNTNDYLIIQIDTDACNQKQFDVSDKDANGNRVSDSELYNRVKERLLRDISDNVKSIYGERIIFAICIDETECWLLPIYYENDKKKCCTTNNCIHKLNEMLMKKNIGYIPEDDKNNDKARAVYDKIFKKIKHKDICNISQYNFGFKSFVNQIDTSCKRKTS